MSDLLDALGMLGRMRRRATALAIWLGFASAMLGIAAAQSLIEYWLDVPPIVSVLWVTAFWAAWTWWHSVLFARHRQRYLRDSPLPYRTAFLRDIFPGITLGFSQMLRPAFNGPNLRNDQLWPHVGDTTAQQVMQGIGVAVFVGAFALFASAWYTLGAARVGFVYEFRPPSQFVAVRRGPYARIRHPLFWSGVGVSWALALITMSPTGIAISVVNTGYGLVYNVIEDRRMCGVIGVEYATYAAEVPRIIPIRKRRAPSAAA